MTEIRPRRTALYMPGINSRALEKARSLPVDCLILDLEDSVAPDQKAAALSQVISTIQRGNFGHREVVVRINGLTTRWGEKDLEAALDTKADAILVPKIEAPEEVEELNARFRTARPESTPALWIMIETPKSILRVEAIAKVAAQPDNCLEAFVMGTNDLTKELGCVQTEDRTALLSSLTHCVLAAKAYSLTIIDGVYNDIKNDTGFRRTAEQGNILGFDGKTLIHPRQIVPCNEIFSPAPEVVEQAQRVIEAFGKPENRSKGVISFEGKMVELLHVDIARRIVRIAEEIAFRDSTE